MFNIIINNHYILRFFYFPNFVCRLSNKIVRFSSFIRKIRNINLHDTCFEFLNIETNSGNISTLKFCLLITYLCLASIFSDTKALKLSSLLSVYFYCQQHKQTYLSCKAIVGQATLAFCSLACTCANWTSFQQMQLFVSQSNHRFE